MRMIIIRFFTFIGAVIVAINYRRLVLIVALHSLTLSTTTLVFCGERKSKAKKEDSKGKQANKFSRTHDHSPAVWSGLDPICAVLHTSPPPCSLRCDAYSISAAG